MGHSAWSIGPQLNSENISSGKERITVDDIVAAISNGQELEPYPDDPRGESCLIVGQGLDSVGFKSCVEISGLEIS